MNSFWFALLVVFAGGLSLGMQAPVNSALAKSVGDSLVATMISFGVGFLCLVVIVVLRGVFPAMSAIRAVQPWMFVGGTLGLLYVWSSIWSVSRLGVVTMVAVLILGQLVSAILIDRFGVFGIPVREISWQRVVAVLLVGTGLVMSRF